MKKTHRLLSWLPLVAIGSLCLSAATLSADQPKPPALPKLDAKDLDTLLTEIKPHQGESPWREIAWLTDVTEARQRAVAEDKPLVIFTAADGSPLGRT